MELILRRAVGELTADYSWRTDTLAISTQAEACGKETAGVFWGQREGTTGTGPSEGSSCRRYLPHSPPVTLIGLDLVKPASDIAAGYADSKGLRKQLARRSIRIMNQRLEANFVEENFQYRRVWNAESSSVEGWLVAVEEARVFIERLQLEVGFSQGEGFQTGQVHQRGNHRGAEGSGAGSDCLVH